MSVNNKNIYFNGIIMYMLKLDVDFLVHESSQNITLRVYI
jgi:hypothetical protein